MKQKRFICVLVFLFTIHRIYSAESMPHYKLRRPPDLDLVPGRKPSELKKHFEEKNSKKLPVLEKLNNTRLINEQIRRDQREKLRTALYNYQTASPYNYPDEFFVSRQETNKEVSPDPKTIHKKRNLCEKICFICRIQ